MTSAAPSSPALDLHRPSLSKLPKYPLLFCFLFFQFGLSFGIPPHLQSCNYGILARRLPRSVPCFLLRKGWVRDARLHRLGVLTWESQEAVKFKRLNQSRADRFFFSRSQVNQLIWLTPHVTGSAKRQRWFKCIVIKFVRPLNANYFCSKNSLSFGFEAA